MRPPRRSSPATAARLPPATAAKRGHRRATTIRNLEFGIWNACHAFLIPNSLLQRERVERIPGADDDELPSVEEKRLRSVRGVGTEAGVPQRCAGGGVVGDEVAAAVVAEQQ